MGEGYYANREYTSYVGFKTAPASAPLGIDVGGEIEDKPNIDIWIALEHGNTVISTPKKRNYARDSKQTGYQR